ncbi:EamA family transporter [Pseudomonas botevensis]
MQWLHGRLGTVVLWALLIILESGGQIASKVGGDHLGQMDFSLQWLQDIVLTPGVWVAIACYVGAFFVWMLILRRSSLSLAFPLSSLVFVGVLLGSWLGLGEQISLLHWVGVAVIMAGIALLAEGEEN